jgi:2'-5' RNA ligase
MYGVIAIFDEYTDRIIRRIWEGLREESLSFYADEVIDRVPHITLASYEKLDERSFMKRMNDIYTSQMSIDISFNSLGSFFKSGALYLSPIMTGDLKKLHNKHHLAFKDLSEHSSSRYQPDGWIPHCTLANRLSAAKLAEVFTYCIGMSTITGKITKIGLIKVQGNTAPVIHSINLR